MPNAPVLEFQQKTTQNIKQLQRLIMSRQIQQAIHVLQVPVMELAPLVDAELEGNPVLEYSEEVVGTDDEMERDLQALNDEAAEEDLDTENIPEKELSFDDTNFDMLRQLDEDFKDLFAASGNAVVRQTEDEAKLQAFLESSLRAKETLFEHLMRQARESFGEGKQLAIAETVIGSIDEAGFLSSGNDELAALAGCSAQEVEEVVQMVQTFDPVGVGARTLQEALLIQLKRQSKEGTLAYRIIEKQFDNLIHNKIPSIRKSLRCTADQISRAVDDDISRLDLHPGLQLSTGTATLLVPDVTIRQEEDRLVVDVNDESVPRLRLNRHYLSMLDDEQVTKEAKDFIRQKVVSAKWLMRNIMQRNTTIERIAHSLAKRQAGFFLQSQGKLVPLTMKTMADELGVHESTVARAVANKYIDCPRGVLPLRSFFTNALASNEGDDISSSTVKGLVKEIIEKEDKSRPLSDEVISAMLKERGITCARRTVAKYRVVLELGTAQQRRKF